MVLLVRHEQAKTRPVVIKVKAARAARAARAPDDNIIGNTDLVLSRPDIASDVTSSLFGFFLRCLKKVSNVKGSG